MKKFFFCLLLIACFFSSPNFASLSSLKIDRDATSQQKVLRHSVAADQKVPLLEARLKHSRNFKRDFFVLRLDDAAIFTLLVFCLFLFFSFVIVFRKPNYLLLRSPPQF